MAKDNEIIHETWEDVAKRIYKKWRLEREAIEDLLQIIWKLLDAVQESYVSACYCDQCMAIREIMESI